MTVNEIEKRFKASIDQWYQYPNKNYVKENQMHHIGGILQAALHILPLDNYYVNN